MARTNKILAWTAAGLGVLIAVLVIGVLILGRTQFGTREIGTRAVAFLDSRIAGDLRVGRVSGGGVFKGLMLHDVAVDDSLGRPFLRADSVRLGYSLRRLIAGDVVLGKVEIFEPVATIERLPGDSVWNFSRVFAPPQPDTTPTKKGRNLVVLQQAVVHGGTVELRLPWEPDVGRPIEPSDTARLILEPAAGGLVRVMRFENLDAEMPRVVIETPEEEGRLFEIARLSARAYVWDRPLELERFEGTVTLRDSLLAFDIDDLRLPDTRAKGVGRYVVSEAGGFDVSLDVDHASLADLQWLRPDLPEEGTASGKYRVQRRGDGTTYFAGEDVDLRAPGTRIDGAFGVVTGDTLYFTKVDLHADPLDLDFVDRMLPLDLPVKGLMIGDVHIQGPISALRTRGNVRLSYAGGGGWSHASWNGVVDARGPYGARDLEASFRSLDPALVALIAPKELQLGQPLTGSVSATGRSNGRVAVSGWLDLPDDDGGTSRVTGSVIADPTANGHRVDIRLGASEFALRRLEKWVPELSVLRGVGTGPVHVVHDGDLLEINGRLHTRTGSIAVAGTIRRGDVNAFDITGELDDVALDEVIENMPASRATGRFELVAAPGVEERRLTVDIDSGSFMAVPVHDGHLGGVIDGDILVVDTLKLETAAGRLAARGRFGLDEAADGALRVRASADSLTALAPLLGMAPDSDVVRGTGDFDGVVRGNHRAFTVSGSGGLVAAMVRGVEAARARYDVDVDWKHEAPTAGRLALRTERTTLQGRRLGAVTFEGNLDRDRTGTSTLVATTPFDQEYAAAVDYRSAGDTTALTLTRASIREGEERWALARPTAVRVDPAGARLDDVMLERAGGGSVRVAGLVPWHAPWLPQPEEEASRASRRVALSSQAIAAPLAALVHLVDPEATIDGVLDGDGSIVGTAAEPVIRARATVRDFRYHDAALERVEASVDYDDLVAQLDVDAFRDDRAVLQTELSLPGRVAFAPFRVDRLELPVRGHILADAMPAALPAGLVAGLRDVSGAISGEIDIRGTPFDMALAGSLSVSDAGFTVDAANVHYRDVNGTVRVEGEQDLIVKATARAGDGRATVDGTINFARVDDPGFSVRLQADRLLLARRADLEAAVNGYVALGGTYRSPEVRGRLDATEGELNLDELIRETQVVGLENPLLMDAVDTSQVEVRRILRENRNAFLEGLDLSMELGVPAGNFWVRSEDLNMEVTGQVQLDYRPQDQDFRMTGEMNAVRGFYNFRLVNLPVRRRFQVREGTIAFVGVPGVNPNIDITAAYRAHTTNGDPLEIQAIVDGTMRSPRVRLTSDADPPISESDLASYMIFGRPTYALSQSEQSTFGITSGSQALNAGLQNAASLIALGALDFASSEVENVVGDLGIDYFSISQAEQGNAAVGLADQVQAGTRVEAGTYLGDKWFVAATPRVAFSGVNGGAGVVAPGGRVEWHFQPTWNAELFWEDRLVQAGSAGFDRNLESRGVLGLFLFREWGY